DAVPEHKFLALRKTIDGGNEPQEELIVGFDGGSCTLEMFVHDTLQKNLGFAPNPQGTKRQRGKETKKQRNKDSRCNKRPANPEAKVVDPLAGAARVARRRAQNVWREVPGTAAVHMVVAVAAFDPGRTIRRRVIIIVVDAILDLLIDVADHVIEAARIGLE